MSELNKIKNSRNSKNSVNKIKIGLHPWKFKTPFSQSKK
jgi:hypothetical protein